MRDFFEDQDDDEKQYFPLRRRSTLFARTLCRNKTAR